VTERVFVVCLHAANADSKKKSLMLATSAAGAKDDFISVMADAAARKMVELSPFAEWFPHGSSMQVQNPTCSTPHVA
jgi:hypothetical protein